MSIGARGGMLVTDVTCSLIIQQFILDVITKSQWLDESLGRHSVVPPSGNS